MAEIIFHSAFSEVAFLLVMAAIVGFGGIILRQPLIVSFIAVGLIAGPSGLDLVHSDEQITLLSELGIALLLFLVGIKLDIKLIRSLGVVSLMTGLGQVAFTSIFGFFIGLALGLDYLTALYVAVALTFSSTIIIVKLLSDKREIDTLHGQIALGFLIVQDLVVVLAMIVLSTVGVGTGEAELGSNSALTVLVSSVALMGAVILFVRYVADPLTERLAKAPELLVIFAIAQAAMFAAVGDIVGLGKEVGGLLAGISLASTSYKETIAARLAPLRDFLLLFFFIALGAALDLTLLGTNLLSAMVFSVFVLIGNPLIVMIIMGVLGYRKQTGFHAGLTVAQISEFSLIFVSMGVTLGHVSKNSLGLVTLVGLITIALSTYMITYSDWLYRLLAPFLGVFERKETAREPHAGHTHYKDGHDVIIFGLGRLGTAIALRLKSRGFRVLGIDYNPEAVKNWRRRGLDTMFGDATDPEFVSTLSLSEGKWVISSIPVHPKGLSHEDTQTTLLQLIRSSGFSGRVAVVSRNKSELQSLMSSGADFVLEPFEEAAERSVELLFGDEGKESSV